MTTIRLFRDPGAGAGGGAEVKPSLADITNLGQPNDPTPLGGTPPAGDPPPADPPPADPAPVEGSDKDGNALPGYEKQDDGTFKKIEDTPPADDYEDDTDEVEAFLTELDNITGVKLDVDYGDVDPLSPQGVAKRDIALRQHTLNEYDNYLKSQLPSAYMYMLHLQAGGSENDFWENPGVVLPSKDKFEVDADLQAGFLRADLLAKDIPADVVDNAIAGYIKNNQLKDKAMALYTTKEKEEQRRIDDLDKASRQATENYNKSVEALDKTMNETLNSMSMIVPEPERKAFIDFIQSNIRYSKEEKAFLFTQALTEKDMKVVMESAFLQFKKGDLKAIVQKEAKKEATSRLRRNIQKDQPARKVEETNPNRKVNLPLGEI